MRIDMEIIADETTKRYYSKLIKKVEEQYTAAEGAKGNGKDPDLEVESKPAVDLADRTEQIIGPKGVAARFRELALKKKERMEVIFEIVEEIMDKRLGGIEELEKRIEQAVKTALVLHTEGVVVAPLDGVPKVKISKNFDGSKYVDVYYAGPIRAAGGSATVLPLLVGDYARKLAGLDRYKPTDDEVERYVEEIQIYDEIFTRQYKMSPEEVRKVIRGCPICINGEPTEKREVTAHKDLERVGTNRVRGGACLVICEGLALKALKIMGEAKKLGLDWSWLEGIIKVSKSVEKEKTVKAIDKFLSSAAAGRPIFAYPSRIGGFRLRYGRARNTGLMGKGFHPATMYLLEGFIASGTQLKIERPGKSTIATPCDSIEGPIVRLVSGEVVQFDSLEDAIKLKPQVERILFLGDCLVAYGDFRHSNNDLVPVGYCEEWWGLELEKLVKEKGKGKFEIGGIIKNPKKIDPYTAVELSMQLGIPLHPNYLHYYNALNKDEVVELIKSVRGGEKVFEGDKVSGVVLDYDVKGLLEKAGVPHKLENDKVKIGEKQAYPFLKTFGGLSDVGVSEDEESVLGVLSAISGMEIRDKGGTFLGGRMGRPEAAKPRKMAGSPHVLFPVGMYGGNTRSILKALESVDNRKSGERGIEVEVVRNYCKRCEKEVEFSFCPYCGERTFLLRTCNGCGRNGVDETCGVCKSTTNGASKRKVKVDELMDIAMKNLKVKVPETLKGVKGLMNENKICEPLEKGILRANNNLNVFKDGTVRFEMLNAPLSHFKPSELNMSVEKARELGYEKDIDGKELVSEEQMLEMFPQDVVINEGAGDFFVRVTKFVDDLLARFYKAEPVYNINNKEELVGELMVSLAPHTSAAVVGRIIGYTEARVNFAHPYFHTAKRRNCDGEQDSFMLLMDVLLNFSKSYLSSSRGGRMDAPLVITIALKPTEIDDEVYNMEICRKYPLELYEKGGEFVAPDLKSIKRVGNILGSDKQYSGMGYTHEVSRFDAGPKVSKYVQLETMEEKIKTQAKLQSKIAVVDEKDALERVMVSHFLPDLIGNARAFSRQTFRCTKCNTIYRRVPLSAKCNKCTGGNIILTISQGSVKKYLKIAKELIRTYGLSNYLNQRIELTEQEIDSVFKNEKPAQKDLLSYV